MLTLLKLKLITCQSKVGLNKLILSDLCVYKSTKFPRYMYGHVFTFAYYYIDFIEIETDTDHLPIESGPEQTNLECFYVPICVILVNCGLST